jgi:hypothetical protein
MTKVDDPGSAIGALRRARELIDDGCERFICIALAEITKGNHSLFDAAFALGSYVSLCCPPYSYENSNLEHWLIVELGLEESLPHGVYQMCRLAWIDRMIYELQTNGALP